MCSVGDCSKGNVSRGRSLKQKLAVGVGNDAVARAVKKLDGAANVLKTAIGAKFITRQPFVGVNGRVRVEKGKDIGVRRF